MADKEKLKDMLDAIIDNNTEKAEVDFHSYLQGKMKDVMHGEEVEEEPAGEVEDGDED